MLLDLEELGGGDRHDRPDEGVPERHEAGDGHDDEGRLRQRQEDPQVDAPASAAVDHCRLFRAGRDVQVEPADEEDVSGGCESRQDQYRHGIQHSQVGDHDEAGQKGHHAGDEHRHQHQGPHEALAAELEASEVIDCVESRPDRTHLSTIETRGLPPGFPWATSSAEVRARGSDGRSRLSLRAGR